jgi:hypothetical protein
LSILPCDRDPVALRVVVGGYWDLDALREDVRGCELCECVRSAMVGAAGAQGGRAGRGAAKSRGSSEYYRALAARRSNP